MYIAYLDEFGHVGSYISRDDPKHNDSPVFGLAGFVLPANEVRDFGTWFFKMKCGLLKWEIDRDGVHPAQWEKKGAALYTARNVNNYIELRKFTNRLLNKIEKYGGFVFYVGVETRRLPEDHDSKRLYKFVLKEAIKRLDEFCRNDCEPCSEFIIVMDEHTERMELITEAAIAMYNPDAPRRSLIEPPFQVESERYQTLQAADWIAGLTGRFGAYWKDQDAYPENAIFRKYFEHRFNQACRRSGIRTSRNSS